MRACEYGNRYARGGGGGRTSWVCGLEQSDRKRDGEQDENACDCALRDIREFELADFHEISADPTVL